VPPPADDCINKFTIYSSVIFEYVCKLVCRVCDWGILRSIKRCCIHKYGPFLGTKKQKYHSEHGCLQCWYTATRIIWIYYKQSNVIIPTYSAYSSFDTCCFELEWFITIDFILIVASMFVVVHRCLDFRWTICIFFVCFTISIYDTSSNATISRCECSTTLIVMLCSIWSLQSCNDLFENIRLNSDSPVPAWVFADRYFNRL
jgi:hypothetical protein